MTDVQNCALKSDGCSVYDEEFQYLHRLCKCHLSNKSSALVSTAEKQCTLRPCRRNPH